MSGLGLGSYSFGRSGDEPEEIVDLNSMYGITVPTMDHNKVEPNSPSAKAMRLMEKGDYHEALQLLNFCLDHQYDTDSAIGSKNVYGDSWSTNGLGSDEVQLLEKRCLVLMRLKLYDKVPFDADRILKKDSHNSIAFKCLIAALCKLNKVPKVNEVLRRWQKNCPQEVHMIECRNKLANLITAVKTGIDPGSAFSDVENILGLNYEWLLGRTAVDEPQWKYRPLPPGVKSFNLCLQYRFGHCCTLGEKCPDAHGKEELEEWEKRLAQLNLETKEISFPLSSDVVYVKMIKEKLQEVGEHNLFCTGNLEEITIKCAQPLESTITTNKMRGFSWKFVLEVKRKLHHVCLLHETHRSSFYIGKSYWHGNRGKELMNPEKCTPEYSMQVLDCSTIEPTPARIFIYSISIVFSPKEIGMLGKFRQSVLFDFEGMDKKLVRHIAMEVVPPGSSSDLVDKEKSPSASNEMHLRSSRDTWNFGNADVVDSCTGLKVSMEKLGFALINGVTRPESSAWDELEPLSKENYKELMRFFLTQEERARQEILAKYNVTAPLTISSSFTTVGGISDGTTRYAVDGELFGAMTLFRDISEDTAVGRLILRSCNYVLLTKTQEARKKDEDDEKKPRVYLCHVVEKAKNAVHINLGAVCVKELELKTGEKCSFDIQFQLDRSLFTEQKKIIDKLSEFHLDMLFPDFETNCSIPWNPMKQWSSDAQMPLATRLNPRQKEAMIAITEKCVTPPILVIGPFGTGKTFTLAQCIKQVLSMEDTRIMVCTHSNSAADLYIKDYLHSWYSKEDLVSAKPLRIYFRGRNLNSVHPNVIKYCKIENRGFRTPTREEVLAHRVIVVTLSTSYTLIDMDLPLDAFTHILLDEAAQAMESEAITPLLFAGPKTKVVLAGDHMQLSPELFSDEAKSLHSSLLERLHYSYPDTHPCKLMLCENYRSHHAILQFASESFYKRKLECGQMQPVHSKFYPLTFFAARGEDVQDPDSTSYYNMSEVYELTERVCELISSWPEKWGDPRSENAIGVLAPYADQVAKIRARLRSKGLTRIAVERVFNVQGKQFRAVFLSTVRTHKPWVRILPEAVGNEVDLGFFSNPKLLNTALTRAQSLVAVVGDPVSLCSVGKCRRLWEDFIKTCHLHNSLNGISYSRLQESIMGVEMRLHWGLNPLASDFVPGGSKKTASVSSGPPSSGSLTSTSLNAPTVIGSQQPVSLPSATPSFQSSQYNMGPMKHQVPHQPPPVMGPPPHFHQPPQAVLEKQRMAPIPYQQNVGPVGPPAVPLHNHPGNLIPPGSNAPGPMLNPNPNTGIHMGPQHNIQPAAPVPSFHNQQQMSQPFTPTRPVNMAPAPGPGPNNMYRRSMAPMQPPQPPVQPLPHVPPSNLNGPPQHILSPAVAAQLLQVQQQQQQQLQSKVVNSLPKDNLSLNAPGLSGGSSYPPVLNAQRPGPGQRLSPCPPFPQQVMPSFPDHLPNSVNLHEYLPQQQQQFYQQQQRRQQQQQQQQQQLPHQQQEQTLYSGTPLFRRTATANNGPLNPSSGGPIGANAFANTNYGLKDDPNGVLLNRYLDGPTNLGSGTGGILPNRYNDVSGGIGNNNSGRNTLQTSSLESRFSNWTPFPQESLGFSSSVNSGLQNHNPRISNTTSGMGSSSLLYSQQNSSLGRMDSTGMGSNSGNNSGNASMLDFSSNLMGRTSSSASSSGLSSSSGFPRNSSDTWGMNNGSGLNSSSPLSSGVFGRSGGYMPSPQRQQQHHHPHGLTQQTELDELRHTQVFMASNLTAELTVPVIGKGLGLTHQSGGSFMGTLKEDTSGDERSYANVVKKASSSAAVGSAITGGSPVSSSKQGMNHSLFLHP